MSEMMIRFIQCLLSAMVVCIFSGCAVVSNEQALREFKTAYPNAIVYEQFVGEGNSDTAYMHFRYTETGSTEKREVMWVYLKQKDGSWRVMSRSEPKPAGARFGD